jgi:hypothetical protein
MYRSFQGNLLCLVICASPFCGYNEIPEVGTQKQKRFMQLTVLEAESSGSPALVLAWDPQAALLQG